jgi:hypothetical protein
VGCGSNGTQRHACVLHEKALLVSRKSSHAFSYRRAEDKTRPHAVFAAIKNQQCPGTFLPKFPLQPPKNPQIHPNHPLSTIIHYSSLRQKHRGKGDA